MTPEKILEIARRYTDPEAREEIGFTFGAEGARKTAMIPISYWEFCEEELLSFAQSLIEAERDTRKLTDEEILDAVNSADFGSMVTADDYIYIFARAIERQINGEEE